MKNTRVLLALIALALLLGGSFAITRLGSPESLAPIEPQSEAEQTDTDIADAAKTNPAAPDFEMTDMQGNVIKLSELAGKPVVLNFWASWCPPCKLEMPHFQAAYEKYGDRINFVMLTMMADPRETAKTASEYLSANKYTFPNYLDYSNEAAIAYGVVSIPRTYTIDADGNFVAGVRSGDRFVPGYVGAMSEELLQSYIDELLDAAEQ